MPDFNLLHSSSSSLTEFHIKLLTVDLMVISGKSMDMRWTISHTSANLKKPSRKSHSTSRDTRG